MCGIVGVYNGSTRGLVEEAVLRRMADAIAHRGPDGEGFHVAPGIGLGHRRLAIVDLAGGSQPMWSRDRRYCIVFNGEIYNYRELTSELKQLGFAFQTNSDTEVILNGWQAWGTACLDRLSGMFAFALWDSGDEVLVLARDRIGKKPLYYTTVDGSTLLFASELKALMTVGGFSRRIAADAVEDYLTLGYVPDPKTIYQGTYKLPPGTFLLCRRGQQPRLESYWDFDLTRRGPTQTLGAAADELSERLRGAVARRMIADVPLGAFLSGGVDSSAIVAHMAKASSAPVKTCTIGFGEFAHDEREYARAVAERYGTDHSEMVISADTMNASPAQLDEIVALYDEPFADSSALPTNQVCRLARQRVTVVLSGDGGDESFAGYRRYLWHVREDAIRRLLPSALRGPLFKTLARIYPPMDRAPRWLRARNTFHELSLDAVDAYLNNVATIPDHLRFSLYTERFKSDLQGYHPRSLFRDLMARAPTREPLLQAQYVDMKTWLAGRMLVKVDRASMANGLEVRNPLLDHDLVQWALTLPDALKCHRGEYKIALKKSVEPLLPAALISRPKQGFSVPLQEWLAGPLRPLAQAALTSPRLLDSGWFDRGALERTLHEHVSGERNHAAPIWSLMILERFLSRHATA